MKDDGRLIVVAGVAFMVAVVLVGVFTPRPPATEPEDPFRDLTFSMDRSRYTFGEKATLVLRNEGNLTFLLHLWGVQGFVDGEWLGVECHSQEAVLFPVRPGDQWSWPWTVETADPICRTFEDTPLPPVEAGLYRGFVSLTFSSGPLRALFDEFAVA